jgi:hypothetical protein
MTRLSGRIVRLEVCVVQDSGRAARPESGASAFRGERFAFQGEWLAFRGEWLALKGEPLRPGSGILKDIQDRKDCKDQKDKKEVSAILFSCP